MQLFLEDFLTSLCLEGVPLNMVTKYGCYNEAAGCLVGQWPLQFDSITISHDFFASFFLNLPFVDETSFRAICPSSPISYYYAS